MARAQSRSREREHGTSPAPTSRGGGDLQDLLGNAALLDLLGGATEAPGAGEGGRGYPKREGEEVPFSTEEQVWIDEVMALQGVQLILGSYELPVAVLHRVRDAGGAAGAFDPAGDDLAISDEVYARVEACLDVGEPACETDEESFKGTLLHELMHFFVENAESLADGVPLPGDLVEVLVDPALAGFGPYAFGWFRHPAVGPVHFSVDGVLPGVLGGDSPWSVRGTPLEAIASDPDRWEASPMPESGGTVSPEEDLAESFGLYLASARTLASFQARYPLRFELVDRYLGGLAALRP